MIRGKLHIVISLLLVLGTTEYLWAPHLLDRNDPIEFESKEQEDLQIKEKEGEKEETKKLSISLDADPLLHHILFFCLHRLYAGRFSVNLDRPPKERLYLLYHNFKVDC